MCKQVDSQQILRDLRLQFAEQISLLTAERKNSDVVETLFRGKNNIQCYELKSYKLKTPYHNVKFPWQISPVSGLVQAAFFNPQIPTKLPPTQSLQFREGWKTKMRTEFARWYYRPLIMFVCVFLSVRQQDRVSDPEGWPGVDLSVSEFWSSRQSCRFRWEQILWQKSQQGLLSRPCGLHVSLFSTDVILLIK